MGLFKKNSAKEIKTTLSMIDGLPDISAGAEMVLSLSGDILSVRPRLAKKVQPYTLNVNKITNIAMLTEKDIIEKSKSVAGRALVGGVFLGPLGAIIGGMSGIGNKSKNSVTTYIVINYNSNGEKVISFAIMKYSIGYLKLYSEIKSRIPETSREL